MLRTWLRRLFPILLLAGIVVVFKPGPADARNPNAPGGGNNIGHCRIGSGMGPQVGILTVLDAGPSPVVWQAQPYVIGDGGTSVSGCPIQRKVQITKVIATFSSPGVGTSSLSTLVLRNAWGGIVDAGRTTIATCTSASDGGTAGRWKAGTQHTCTLSTTAADLRVDIGGLLVEEVHPGTVADKIPAEHTLDIFYKDQEL
jgi:hypothetical protein